MRIGIDARFYNESGVGRYIRNLITNLKLLDKKNQYYIFLLPGDFKQFIETKNFKKVQADFKWYGFAEQFKFPKLLNKYKLDLVHFPHFNVPIFYKSHFVVTIHDLIHQHFQMKRATTLNPILYKFKHFGYRKVFRNAISGSEKIIVPSKYVANLLMNEWEVTGKKITVTHEAVDENLSSIEKKITKSAIEQVMKKFKIFSPFIFYIGNAHPHKNIEGLIKAFRQFKKNFRHLQLVLAGRDHYFWQRIKKEYLDKDIVYVGEITDWELIAIYKSAKCFVNPSLDEGFGIPNLEAMLVGCPVVSSNRGSLPEVGADAVIYFDPENVTEMAESVGKVLKSEKLRQDLRKKAFERVKLFSWEKLAQETMGVYETCG